MKKYMILDQEYELIEDYKNGFDYEETKDKCTDYFTDYDYIIGDYSYGKLRLKGFCDAKNKLKNSINDINNKDNYIKDSCAYGCKYFVLKKITK